MSAVTFLVTRFPSSSVNCSSITDSPGMFLASSPCGEGVNMGWKDGGVKVSVEEVIKGTFLKRHQHAC